MKTRKSNILLKLKTKKIPDPAPEEVLHSLTRHNSTSGKKSDHIPRKRRLSKRYGSNMDSSLSPKFQGPPVAVNFIPKSHQSSEKLESEVFITYNTNSSGTDTKVKDEPYAADEKILDSDSNSFLTGHSEEFNYKSEDLTLPEEVTGTIYQIKEGEDPVTTINVADNKPTTSAGVPGSESLARFADDESSDNEAKIETRKKLFLNVDSRREDGSSEQDTFTSMSRRKVEFAELFRKRAHQKSVSLIHGNSPVKSNLVVPGSLPNGTNLDGEVNGNISQIDDGRESDESEDDATTRSNGKTQVSETEIDRVNSDVNLASSASSDETTAPSELETECNRETENEKLEDPFIMWYRETQHGGSLHGSHAATSDKINCYVWSDGESVSVRKTELTLLDIGWSIIQTVQKVPDNVEFLRLSLFFLGLLSLVPWAFRGYVGWPKLAALRQVSMECNDVSEMVFNHTAGTLGEVFFSNSQLMPLYLILSSFLRAALFSILLLLMCVAQRAYCQRLLYAKHFCYLTSSRRARKYDLPHFRLNKARNIKVWLSLRSYLKKRGPQRSINSVIAASFYIFMGCASLMCYHLLQGGPREFLDNMGNWDLIILAAILGFFVLRYLTLGTKINRKFRNLSVLITEQLNLYLCMEAKPHKKEELQLANNVLRLAEDLLKELDGPFRICGWSVNPLFYNILKVVILSALSAVLSDLIGFKLKLYKIKLNPQNW